MFGGFEGYELAPSVLKAGNPFAQGSLLGLICSLVYAVAGLTLF